MFGMNSFTLMWAKMLDSSVWQTTKEARLLWVTMLLMKDREGIVRASIPGLAHRAVLTLEECEEALKVLSDPDPYSQTPTADGRRIVKVEGGWLVVNHELYRTSEEAKKEQDRVRQAKHRMLKVADKIAKSVKAQEKVRSKFNPKFANDQPA